MQHLQRYAHLFVISTSCLNASIYIVCSVTARFCSIHTSPFSTSSGIKPTGGRCFSASSLVPSSLAPLSLTSEMPPVFPRASHLVYSVFSSQFFFNSQVCQLLGNSSESGHQRCQTSEKQELLCVAAERKCGLLHNFGMPLRRSFWFGETGHWTCFPTFLPVIFETVMHGMSSQRLLAAGSWLTDAQGLLDHCRVEFHVTLGRLHRITGCGGKFQHHQAIACGHNTAVPRKVIVFALLEAVPALKSSLIRLTNQQRNV